MAPNRGQKGTAGVDPVARIRYPLARHVDHPEEHTAAPRRFRVHPWTPIAAIPLWILAVLLVWFAVPAFAGATSPTQLRPARHLGTLVHGPRSATTDIAPPTPRIAGLAPAVSTALARPHLGLWSARTTGFPTVAASPVWGTRRFAAPPIQQKRPEPAPSTAPSPAPRQADHSEQRRSILLQHKAVPPFWFKRTYNTHTTHSLVFPPLYVHRVPKPGFPEKALHLDLGLTFGWYSEATAQRRWLSLPALFYGAYSERKTVWGTVPLLMGYRRVGEQFNFAQFPLVWWWGTRYVKNFLFIPFHYQQKAPDGFRGVSALLFWYGHKHLDDKDIENDRRHFVAAPLFYRFSWGQKRFDFAFLYVGGANRAKGRRWANIAPFALWREEEFGNRKELWSWAWIRRKDRARGRDTWAVPLALTLHHSDPVRRLLMATPLVWRSQNRLRGSDLLVAGPYVGYRDPRQRISAIAPLWWRFEDRQHATTTSFLFPLAVARRTPQRRAVWTLLGGGMRSKNGYGAAIPPLLTYVGRREDGTRIQGILGVFWHLRRTGSADQARHTTVLAPLGFWDRRSDRLRAGLPPLLLFAGAKGTTRWQVITPLLWHVHDRAAGRRTVVAGPFYRHRTRAGVDWGTAPLWFAGANDRYRYTTVPLLLFGDVTDVKAGRRLTLSPLFVRHHDRNGRTIGAAGLVWDVLRQGGAERHTLVLPLFYRRKLGNDRLVLSPIGGMLRRGSRTTAVFGPYVRRQSPGRTVHGVLPLIWTGRRDTPEGPVRTAVVAPFYFHHRGPQDRLHMFTPLIWHRSIGGDHPRRGLAVVPFYFRQRQPTGVDVDAGPGFFYSRNRERHTHTLMAGPFFHRLSRTSLHTGVAPLWWWMDSQEQRRLIALPGIVHLRDKIKDEHTTVAIPFWFDRKRPNGSRTWTAFPFVVGVKRLYNFTRVSLLPPGYIDVLRLQKNRRWTTFGPLVFRVQQCGFRAEDDPRCAYKLWGALPLFVYGKDGMGRVTHGSLLYVYDKRPGRTTLYTPLFGVRYEPNKHLGWYAGPIAVKTTNTLKRVMVFPLYFRRAHRLEKRSLTLVAPPLFIGRQREDRSFFEAGLLVWQTRRPHKVSTAVLPPLFYHSHTYAQRKLTWLLPVFLRDNNMGADQSWTAVAPAAFVHHRHGDQRDFVQFPLVWHIERGENQGTFGAFVWWDIRAKGRTVQVVPGAFLRVASPRRDTRVIGPGLGWWTRGKGSNEGDFHWRALFGILGGGVEAGRKYLSIFGGRIDRGPGTAPPPRVRRTRSARRTARIEARRRARQARSAARERTKSARIGGHRRLSKGETRANRALALPSPSGPT